MKALIAATAVIELAAGLLLLALPSQAGTLLLGSPLRSPVEFTIARVAGVALLALGVACWLARSDEQSRAARGLIGAMLVYNAGVAAVLAYAGIGLGLSGIGLWPAVLLHAAMAVWCIMRLRPKPAQTI